MHLPSFSGGENTLPSTIPPIHLSASGTKDKMWSATRQPFKLLTFWIEWPWVFSWEFGASYPQLPLGAGGKLYGLEVF